MQNQLVVTTRLAALIVGLFGVASLCRAQQYPRWEMFTGFSYAHVDLGQQSSTFQPTDKNY
jgi:hypothetical protein